MKIKEVIENMNLKDKRKNPHSCHWDKKFVKREFMDVWEKSKGKTENKYICLSGSCTTCQNLDSKFIIPLTKEQRKLNNV